MKLVVLLDWASGRSVVVEVDGWVVRSRAERVHWQSVLTEPVRGGLWWEEFVGNFVICQGEWLNGWFGHLPSEFVGSKPREWSEEMTSLSQGSVEKI